MELKKILAATALVAVVGYGATADNHRGDVSEQVRTVADFDRVSLNGFMDVTVKVGSEKSVTVIADADVIDDLLTDVDGDRLVVRMRDGKSYRNVKKALVEVTVPSLEQAGVHGSGDMVVEGAQADSFKFSVHGSGDATLKNAVVQTLELSVHGSGDIRADGTCESADVSVHGSGDITAKSMECKIVDASVHGSGDVTIYAAGKVGAGVYGSGDVTVYGTPEKVRSKVRGSGDVDIR